MATWPWWAAKDWRRGAWAWRAPLCWPLRPLCTAARGRVLVALLDNGQQQLDPQQPELMFRRFEALALEQLTVVCGCGGGQAIARVLPEVITPRGPTGAGCRRAQHHRHPGRTARAGGGTRTARASHGAHTAPAGGRPPAGPDHRRGPGQPAWMPRSSWPTSSTAWPCSRARAPWLPHPTACPAINPTGNARLATAGTGDVLAGMVGAHPGRRRQRLARCE